MMVLVGITGFLYDLINASPKMVHGLTSSLLVLIIDVRGLIYFWLVLRISVGNLFTLVIS